MTYMREDVGIDEALIDAFGVIAFTPITVKELGLVLRSVDPHSWAAHVVRTATSTAEAVGGAIGLPALLTVMAWKMKGASIEEELTEAFKVVDRPITAKELGAVMRSLCCLSRGSRAEDAH